jgi:dihydroorotate dehydrogenase
MVHIPYYDPDKSYDENYKKGPFGAFADKKIYKQTGQPTYDFFGTKVYLPFGIPAGPIINANYAKAAFDKGFDLVVYKTVRTKEHGCHPWPNIIPVNIDKQLSLEQAAKGLIKAKKFSLGKGFTNSLGVPSKDPDQWQHDMVKAIKAAKKGQVLIGSYQGTNRGEGRAKFIEEHVVGAQLVQETGVRVIELNLSCPNEGTADLLCFDTETVYEIVKKVKNKIGNIPLIIKTAYFKDQKNLENFTKKVGSVVDGMATINTIPAAVYDEKGKQALPGEGRLRSGVCGPVIKWAGLEMVERLVKLREKFKLDFKVIGVGGVASYTTYKKYMKAGSYAVMSAIGSMWNPYLAQDIKGKD